MTPAERAVLMALHAATTQGEWWYSTGSNELVLGDYRLSPDDGTPWLRLKDDGPYLAAAHDAVPKLVAALAKAEAREQESDCAARVAVAALDEARVEVERLTAENEKLWRYHNSVEGALV